MTVLMTLRVKGDPAKLEAYAAEHGDEIRGISGRGREAGAVHHAFYAGGDGEVMVLDEWPDQETFQKFFQDEREGIEAVITAVADGQPEITFWEKIDIGDEF